MKNTREISKVENLDTDIVVIGGGGCGLAAAAAAAEKGARVILLEKNRNPGGNTMLVRGTLAVESSVQRRHSIVATRDEAFKLAMDYSHWNINPRIFRAFINRTADTIEWLIQRGVRFTDVPHCGPGQVPRTWHATDPELTGPVIVKTLRKYCENMGVQVFSRCPAKKILTGSKGNITGVLATMQEKELKITAKSVIIATGGYGGNKKLLKKYNPSYTEEMVCRGLPLMGDGLLMAMEAGAATEGLGNLLVHPHCYPESGEIDAFVVEPRPIWVNKYGERFITECHTNPVEFGNAVARQPGKCSYVLCDEKIKQRAMEEGLWVMNPSIWAGMKPLKLDKEFRSHADKGGVKISNSWDEIAKWIGVAPKVLKATIQEYNSFCDQGYDEVFNKDRRYLQALRTPPYYAIKCPVSFLCTIGGIKINQHMEVLNDRDNPIIGLYAGGDTTGGWESESYCFQLSGTASSFAINSGRIAGENATKHILKS